MATALTHPKLDIDAYIAAELHSDTRHEYLAGEAHAMVGASAAHNIIAGNLFAALHPHLRGGPCRVFMSDMKVRVRVGQDDYLYYPDVMVACRPDDSARYYREQPLLLVEVMSETTERVDRREKLLVYRNIPALEEYLLLTQDSVAATHYRRAGDWGSHQLTAGDELVLACLDFRIGLAALYEGVPGQ